MRVSVLLVIALVLSGCDDSRVYEKNYDFSERQWAVNEKPSFEFTVQKDQPYNLFCNLRNGVSYPYSRIFINYSLKDSTDAEISHKMISTFLFDEKTGEPLGSSGLGDIYDHQIPLLTNFNFKKAGTYTLQFEQFMRTDTLQGILAVGLRLEKVVLSE
jgi:gliding motility-associated lipoprotein GldH